jgi:hypothetical protein
MAKRVLVKPKKKAPVKNKEKAFKAKLLGTGLLSRAAKAKAKHKAQLEAAAKG